MKINFLGVTSIATINTTSEGQQFIQSTVSWVNAVHQQTPPPLSIFTRVCFSNGHRPEVANNSPIYQALNALGNITASIPITQIYPAFKILPRYDVLLQKTRYGTNLLEIPSTQGIDIVILSGLRTSRVFMSTAYSPFDQNYKVYVISNNTIETAPDTAGIDKAVKTGIIPMLPADVVTVEQGISALGRSGPAITRTVEESCGLTRTNQEKDITINVQNNSPEAAESAAAQRNAAHPHAFNNTSAVIWRYSLSQFWVDMEVSRWQTAIGRSLITFSERYRIATFPFHAGEVVTSFIAYNGMFQVIAPIVSRAVIPEYYNRWDRKTKTSWHVRIVSFTQATLICAMALRIIATDSDRRTSNRDDRLWGYTGPAGRLQAFALGYFLYDTWISVQHYDVLGPTSLVHGLCASIISILGFRPFANYYGVNFILYELSTPFLNVHWLLDKLQLTGSSLQLYNGICLMGTFFASRLVWGSYQTWLLSQDIWSSWQSHQSRGEVFSPRIILDHGVWRQPAPGEGVGSYGFPKLLLATYLVANTILTGLNFYWFSLMIKAMRKRFSGGNTKTQKQM